MSDSYNEAREVLANPSSSLAQIMQAIGKLENSDSLTRQATVGISSSVTVDLLGVYLKKHALLSGVRLDIHKGNYDDPLGDIDAFARSGVEHLVLFPFFDNLLPSFEAQVPRLSTEFLAGKEAEMRGKYRLALERAAGFRTVFLASYHRFSPVAEPGANDEVRQAIDRFNQALLDEAKAFSNVRTIDTGEIVGHVGRAAAFDPRFYYRGKAPYTGGFLNEFARRLTLASRGFDSHFYKALVLDCDNTLWGGVIGEDLLHGIKLGPYDYPGNIFWRVQHEFSALERNGIILCLCSKNNASDVDDVFDKHQDMVLKNDQIVLKKVNWQDKAQNIREIAQELNIGLDSLVFVDDSSFECEAVRNQLPMVKTVQVPEVLSDYPRIAHEIKELFLAGGISDDSRSKTEQYRQRAQAEEIKAQFASHDEYLASLQLRVQLARNVFDSIPRISELTKKSNQFNLTTRRYSESEIAQLMDSRNSTVYSLVVSDKFGSAGLTGVVVVKYEGNVAIVDSFLMSCRVIGRGVEFSIWPQIARHAAERGCVEIRAEYLPTAKNAQVADFYDRLGLRLVSEDAGVRKYASPIDSFETPATSWIEVTNV